MSGLLGFLGVAWVFYARHSLGALLFGTPSVDYVHRGDRIVASLRSTVMMAAPLLLILLSVFCYFRYNAVLEDSIAAAQAEAVLRTQAIRSVAQDPRSLLATTPVDHIPKRAATLAQIDYEIPYGGVLAMLYLGIFLCAELAFVLMATREYLQSLMRRTDEQIIYGLQGRTMPSNTT